MDSTDTQELTNGEAMAAIVAAGVGCAILGVFSLLGDAFKSIGAFFSFYGPSGALSGVTTCAIVVWLVTWFVLAKRWSGRNVAVAANGVIALALLAVGLLLTFPPFMDLLQGR